MPPQSNAVLKLQIIKQPATVVGVDRMMVFSSSGGSVGRSTGASFVLPDPNRYISSQHILITCHQGRFSLTDTSSNGTYINDADTALGMGNSVSLNNGDRISLGEYELMVRLEVSEEETLPPDAVIYLGQTPDTGVYSSVPEDSVEQLDEVISSHQHMGMSEAESLVLDQLIAALGLVPASFSDASKAELIPKVAELLRASVKALMTAVAARAEIKNALRLEMTSIRARENNPLKFSASVHEALQLLLNNQPSEALSEQPYLSAKEALAEVDFELSEHQAASLTAMEGSVSALLKRFDPAELTTLFDEQQVGLSLIHISEPTRPY